jgi:hypothetical protein
MDRELKIVLPQLVDGRMIAALGTLHQGRNSIHVLNIRQ